MRTALSLSTFAVAASLAVANANPAQAGTLTYDLGGSNQSSAEFLVAPVGSDGPTISVTGSEAGVAKNVRRRSNGVGVQGSNNGGQIDGRGGDFETLLLEFDKTVRIISANFAAVQNNDEFTLLVDGNEFVTSEDIVNNFFDFSSLSGGVGKQFGFTVRELNDDYRLAGITVETVPEPASVLALLALGTVGAISTSKKKKVS
ncbi:MAG: PEP-CTERM sorting domain-containing protein [Spirulinaceae cyanobacterium]